MSINYLHTNGAFESVLSSRAFCDYGNVLFVCADQSSTIAPSHMWLLSTNVQLYIKTGLVIAINLNFSSYVWLVTLSWAVQL